MPGIGTRGGNSSGAAASERLIGSPCDLAKRRDNYASWMHIFILVGVGIFRNTPEHVRTPETGTPPAAAWTSGRLTERRWLHVAPCREVDDGPQLPRVRPQVRAIFRLHSGPVVNRQVDEGSMCQGPGSSFRTSLAPTMFATNSALYTPSIVPSLSSRPGSGGSPGEAGLWSLIGRCAG